VCGLHFAQPFDRVGFRLVVYELMVDLAKQDQVVVFVKIVSADTEMPTGGAGLFADHVAFVANHRLITEIRAILHQHPAAKGAEVS
jgi:hypothetical protein